MVSFVSPVGAALVAAGSIQGDGHLSASFLSTTAQVLPTLVIALALQVGIAYSRFAGPLRRMPRFSPGAHDARYLYVTQLGPIPKLQTAALLSLVSVFGFLVVGEVHALAALAPCEQARCITTEDDLNAIVAAYSAAATLIALLVVVDLLPRLTSLPWGMFAEHDLGRAGARAAKARPAEKPEPGANETP